MDNEKQKEQEEKAKVLNDNQINIIIPQCCREGWPTCPHIPKQQRKVKQNVGL